MFITCHGTASVSSSTLCHWLLALKLWQEINGGPWLGCSTLKCAVKVVNFNVLTYATKAVALLTLPPSHRQCNPVMIWHLKCLCNGLYFNDPFDAAMYALACLRFWSKAHLGELTFNNDFDP